MDGWNTKEEWFLLLGHDQDAAKAGRKYDSMES